MAGSETRESVVDFYTDVVLPALAQRLDAVFPEFGWRRDARGWVATNEETTHRALGVRAERVVAHGPAPRGFLVHGGEPMLWTAYLNGGSPARGIDFVRAVRDLAGRAGVDASALEQEGPRDRRADVLDDFFALAERELVSERGRDARAYLASRGLSPEVGSSGLGLVPAPQRTRSALLAQDYREDEIAAAGFLADGRWPGRICGAWRDSSGRTRTLWARAIVQEPAETRYLYLRGASRTGLPPYGFSDVLAAGSDCRGDLVLVEGLLDVHHLRARGFRSIAALGGVAITSKSFERLASRGVERVTLCFDRDSPGRGAAARAVDAAVRAQWSPEIFVLDPEHLAPKKDPDALVRAHGIEHFAGLLEKRVCGVVWRAAELLGGVEPDAGASARRSALARAGAWLGTLPPRLALEQEDAVRVVAERSGYSPPAVERAFRARYWSASELPSREAASLER